MNAPKVMTLKKFSPGKIKVRLVIAGQFKIRLAIAKALIRLMGLVLTGTKAGIDLEY